MVLFNFSFCTHTVFNFACVKITVTIYTLSTALKCQTCTRLVSLGIKYAIFDLSCSVNHIYRGKPR